MTKRLVQMICLFCCLLLLPLGGQVPLLVHENQIPGSAVVIIAPENMVLAQEQIKKSLRRLGQALNGQIPAGQMGLSRVAGAVIFAV